MRRLRDTHGWLASGELSHPRGSSRRLEHYHDRGSDRRSEMAWTARIVLGVRRRAVWHLHSGYDFGRGAFAGEKTPANEGRNPRRPVGKYLPLHGLWSDSGSRGRSCEAERACMRSDPAEFEFVAPASLQAALKLLSEQPEAWLPIAGG